MEHYLLDYYYNFLHERHYFECHEIMEDAWKAKPDFNKADIEVAFIMLATAQYHDRRNNKNGASRCLKKSIQLFQHHQHALPSVGLQDTIIAQLTVRLNAIQQNYEPLQLPLTPQCLQELLTHYPNFNPYRPANSQVIHYHATRDRSDIIQLRESRLMDNKNPVDDSPDKCH